MQRGGGPGRRARQPGITVTTESETATEAKAAAGTASDSESQPGCSLVETVHTGGTASASKSAWQSLSQGLSRTLARGSNKHKIISKSFGNMRGIYLDYSSACESALACSSNAIGMPLLSQYTYFGCQGCLIFSAKRGWHACQRQSVSTWSPMWRSIDCDVAAAANPRKIS